MVPTLHSVGKPRTELRSLEKLLNDWLWLHLENCLVLRMPLGWLDSCFLVPLLSVLTLSKRSWHFQRSDEPKWKRTGSVLSVSHSLHRVNVGQFRRWTAQNPPAVRTWEKCILSVIEGKIKGFIMGFDLTLCFTQPSAKISVNVVFTGACCTIM